jgi:hypothetical protein
MTSTSPGWHKVLIETFLGGKLVSDFATVLAAVFVGTINTGSHLYNKSAPLRSQKGSNKKCPSRLRRGLKSAFLRIELGVFCSAALIGVT